MYKVTQDHIENGTIGSGRRCPVALCLQENFNKDSIVFTGRVQMSYNRGKYRTPESYALSPDITHWISRFDAGLNVSKITLIFTGKEFYIMDEGENEDV